MDEKKLEDAIAEDFKEIAKYGAKWDLDEHEGYLWLKDTSGTIYEERVDSAKELNLLIHLLQTESPLYYHPKDHYIATSIEVIGREHIK